MISFQESLDDLFDNPRERMMNLPYTAQQVVRKPIDRKPRLFFTIGLQRSGKSTYCTRWAQNLEMPGDGCPRAIVCADSIRLRHHGERYLRKPEPFIFTFDTLMIESLLERGHDVIADETATTERSIRRILSIDIDAQHIVIDTPKEECQRRAILTGQDDLVPVIERVSVQFEKLRRIGFDNAVGRVRNAVRNRNDSPVL